MTNSSGNGKMLRILDPEILLLSLLVLGSLWMTFGLYFLGDDFNFVTGNFIDDRLMPLGARLRTYYEPNPPWSWKFLRPTTVMSFWLDSALWGDNAFGFRLTTFFLQLAAVLGVYSLAREVKLPRTFALAWAMVFAIHPLSVESYSWLCARSDVMVVAFGTWGTLLLLGSGPRKWTRNLMGCVLLWLAATSKEHGLLFLVLPFAIWIVRGRLKPGLVGVVAMPLLYLLYRRYMVAHVVGGYSNQIDPLGSFGSTLALFWNHVWPWEGGIAWPLPWVAVLGVVLGVVASAWAPLRKRFWTWSSLCLLIVSLGIGHVILSTFEFKVGVFGSMRLGYAMLLPFSFLLALGAWGLVMASLSAMGLSEQGPRVFVVVICVYTGVLTYQQQRNYADFVAASRLMRTFISQAQELDAKAGEDCDHVIVDLPRTIGCAFAGINMSGQGNARPFFDPRDPGVRIRPASAVGWQQLAMDLYPPERRIELHRWSQVDHRIIGAELGPLEVRHGRITRIGPAGPNAWYQLEGHDGRIHLANHPDERTLGSLGTIRGCVFEGSTESVFLAGAFLADADKVLVEITGDTSGISAERGGIQNYRISMTPDHAGLAYLVLGSLLGEGNLPLPGGLYLPLQLDSYTILLILAPNSIVSGSLGVLDEQGQARASLTLPAGSRFVRVGMKFTHACVVVDPKSLDIVAVSEPWICEITK